VQGLTPLALSAAVPPVAGWHDTGIPPRLSAEDVEALLEACDRSTPTGVRDFAMVTLLANAQRPSTRGVPTLPAAHSSGPCRETPASSSPSLASG
jgi:hypothetical protein